MTYLQQLYVHPTTKPEVSIKSGVLYSHPMSDAAASHPPIVVLVSAVLYNLRPIVQFFASRTGKRVGTTIDSEAQLALCRS